MSITNSRPSDAVLLYINLALGVLTTLANGGALMLTLTGRADQLAGKELEISLWVTLGVVLVGASIVGILQNRQKEQILKIQAAIIGLLCVLLALWGLTIVLGKIPASRIIWSFGYLSLATIYSTYLFTRSFTGPSFRSVRLYTKVLFLPFCILVDVATFLRVGGLLNGA